MCESPSDSGRQVPTWCTILATKDTQIGFVISCSAWCRKLMPFGCHTLFTIRGPTSRPRLLPEAFWKTTSTSTQPPHCRKIEGITQCVSSRRESTQPHTFAEHPPCVVSQATLSQWQMQLKCNNKLDMHTYFVPKRPGGSDPTMPRPRGFGGM